MSEFILNEEMALDTLIFWIESTDGAISFKENETVKRVLDTMDYDFDTYRKTLTQIGALSTEKMKVMIEEAIDYVKQNFTDEKKKLSYALLDSIAHCDGALSKEQEQRMDRLKGEFGL